MQGDLDDYSLHCWWGRIRLSVVSLALESLDSQCGECEWD